MTKLEQLTAVIQKACPELLNLEFGCKFLVTLPSGRSDIYSFLRYSHQDRASFLRGDCSTPVWFSYSEYKLFKILGREPQLAEVLRAALNKAQIYDRDNNTTTAEVQYLQRTRGWILDIWDLSKDLNSQKTEVIDFLHKLLCEK